MSKDIDITLFEPTTRDMVLDYPEFKGYKEFENLSFREIRLCWLVGNRTSPIAGYEGLKRIRAAVKEVYTKVSSTNTEVADMMEGKIPHRIKNGIARMASFRPSVRLRAKLMDEYVFDQLNGLLYMSEDEKKAMDEDEKKKYTDRIIKISSELPSLVTRMEAGYGIKISKEEEEDVSVKANITDVRDRLT